MNEGSIMEVLIALNEALRAKNRRIDELEQQLKENAPCPAATVQDADEK